MLVRSVMPLTVLTLVVLGVILFGITTATESAAVGAAGAFLMAWHAGTLNFERIKEAVFLTSKTTSMVCWLFVGSALFSAVFAILGGQRLVEEWVMALNLTPIQFLLLSQAVIFILGWPLEWTEIIVIFMPIFIPLLDNFGVDPLFFGLLVALTLQTAFLSPPVAMSAYYLKAVAPDAKPHDPDRPAYRPRNRHDLGQSHDGWLNLWRGDQPLVAEPFEHPPEPSRQPAADVGM